MNSRITNDYTISFSPRWTVGGAGGGGPLNMDPLSLVLGTETEGDRNTEPTEEDKKSNIYWLLERNNTLIYIFYLYLFNRKKLVGLEVRYNDSRWKIKNIKPNRYLTDVDVTLGSTELLTRIRTQVVRLYNCAVDIPQDFNIDETRKLFAIDLLIRKMNYLSTLQVRQLGQEINLIASKITKLGSLVDKDDVKYWRKMVEELKARLKEAEKKTKTFTAETFLNEIKKIKDHDLIEKVEVSRRGNMLITTKNLPSRKWNRKTDLKRDMGRFEIQINFDNFGYPEIWAENMDYVVSGAHYHPQISGVEICMGNEKSILTNYKDSLEIYLLVDHLLTLLTTVFQEDSTYFVEPEAWFASRKKISDIDQREWSLSHLSIKGETRWTI